MGSPPATGAESTCSVASTRAPHSTRSPASTGVPDSESARSCALGGSREPEREQDGEGGAH